MVLQDDNGEEYPAARLNQAGWDWIEANEEMFSLKKATNRPHGLDDDIPF